MKRNTKRHENLAPENYLRDVTPEQKSSLVDWFWLNMGKQGTNKFGEDLRIVVYRVGN